VICYKKVPFKTGLTVINNFIWMKFATKITINIAKAKKKKPKPMFPLTLQT